jgi:hypothetical protein
MIFIHRIYYNNFLITNFSIKKKDNHNEKLKIKYPSFESVFICNHKYYQRKNSKNPIKYNYIDIDDNIENIQWNEMPQFPFFFKAPELQMNVHQYIIENRDHLNSIVQKLRIDLPNYNIDTKYINQNYLNLEKYPLVTKSLMICEEFMNNCLQLNWEGWADHQGNIFTYGFTDEILADYGIFSDFIMPDIILKQSENICFDYLKSISFKNSFVNIELWINNSDYSKIFIIEVNPRSAFSYHNQYKTSFHRTKLFNYQWVIKIIKLNKKNKFIQIIFFSFYFKMKNLKFLIIVKVVQEF